jgi:MOSC domain-containing protein YiiM
MAPRVAGLCTNPTHSLAKEPVSSLQLLAGVGVEGDAHAGRTIQHRSRVAVHPSQPNLRQVHLIAKELLAELELAGFEVMPGRLGENILTEGVDLLGLPVGTRLELGPRAVVELTGLRNPCAQLNDVAPGLMQSLVTRGEDGHLIRRAGVMAIVQTSGEVAQGDVLRIVLPGKPHRALDRV